MVVIPLQGVFSPNYESTQFDFNQDLVEDSLHYAETQEELEFPHFKDAWVTALAMQGYGEYDEYRTEILSELYVDLTKFGTSSEVQNHYMNKIAQQLNINFDYDMGYEVKQNLAQQQRQKIKKLF